MTHNAGAQQIQPDGRRRTLRLALAMRGGVSLAVWIGGAVSEIDLFRRACNAPGTDTDVRLADGEREQHHQRARIYRSLFAATKYRRVEVDILAGASAGGLNAVLYGLAQSCGRVMDELVRRTWVDSGGMWELLREPGFGRVPSLLKGDEQLFKVIRDTLRSIANPMAEQDPGWRPLTATPADRVTVELAATLLDDFHNPERDNRARFSFIRTPGDLSSHYTTIPGPVNDDVSKDQVLIALDRMALAARATSSFPGAFEPAEITAASEEDEDPEIARFRDGCAVNMARAFLYSRNARTYSEPFNVVDGGIYDNIPIGRTIRAIQRSPSSLPSERLLIYLDPEPPTPREPATGAKERLSAVSWIPVIRSSIALKQRSETAASELNQIREHNEIVLRIQGRQEALAAALQGIRSLEGLQAVPGKTLSLGELISDESYVQCRIAMDSERIASLLTDPWSELCRPPREAVDYSALNSSNALRIEEWLSTIYNAEATDWDLPKDVYAMLDWIRVLVAWVHALEDVLECLGMESPQLPKAQKELAERLSFWKQNLYRCLTVLIEAKQRTVDLVLVEPLSNNPWVNASYGVETLRESLKRSHYKQQSLEISSSLAEFVWNVGELGGRRSSDKDFYNCLGRADSLGEGIGGKPVGGFLRWVLDGLRGQIGKHSAAVVSALPKSSNTAWLKTWRESPFVRFYSPPLNEFRIDSLSRLFAITGGPAATPLIAFDQITSDEPPALELPALEDAARVKQLEMWLRRPPTDLMQVERMQRVLSLPPQALLKADAKLAGNAFSRFGGFFLGRWRENDWQWGRLDAAAGIARILNQSRGDERLSDDDIRARVNELQTSIKEESRQSAQQHTTKHHTERQTIVETAGADSLDAISPHYRFSLISRVVPLVCRALLPPKGSTTSIAGAATVLGQFIIRPLAVPLTLIADPLRLAFAMVVITGALALLGAGTSPTGWQIVFSIVFIVLAVFVGARAVKAESNWRKLSAKIDELAQRRPDDRIAELWKPIVTQANLRRNRIWSGFVALGMFGSATYHLVALGAGWPHLRIPLESFTIAILGSVLLQDSLNRRTYRMRPARSATMRRKILAWLTGLAAVGVVLIAEAIAAQEHNGASRGNAICVTNFADMKRLLVIPSGGWDKPPGTLAVAAVAVGLLTFISLWGWASNGWVFVWMVVGAALGAGTQWFFDAWMAGGWRLWDLLPVLVWMVLVGAIAPKVPYRRKHYGETGRPELVAPNATPAAHT